MQLEKIIEDKVLPKLKGDPEKYRDINAKVAIVLKGPQSRRVFIDFTLSSPVLSFDDKRDADTTITMDDDVFVKSIEGKMNPQMAFITGKIKVDGDLSLVIKLGSLF